MPAMRRHRGDCARFRWTTAIATALAASRRITSTATALATKATRPGDGDQAAIEVELASLIDP